MMTTDTQSLKSFPLILCREDPDTSSLRCLFWYSEEKPLGGSNDALAWAVSPVADHQRMGGVSSYHAIEDSRGYYPGKKS